MGGAFFGFFVDNFDIYLPLIALAPAMLYFVPASIDAGTAALIASWVFVATLIGRPLGSFIFGSLADSIGRRKSTLIAVAGFGIATLIMACLPGYQTVGIGGVIALIALRFIAGVLLGGEYSGANVLAMEESPREKRGLFGGIVQMGAGFAAAIVSLLTFVLLAIIPGGAVSSPYVQWGWRIPFFVGAALAFVFLIYYSRNVSESTVWKKSDPAEKSKLSLFTLFRGRALVGFIQVFVWMTGLWFLLNTVTALIPQVLTKTVKLTSSESTLVFMVTWLVLTGMYVVGGVISQRIGRRTYLIATGILALVIGIPAYWMLINVSQPNVWVAMLPAVIAAIFIVSPWAVVTSYLSERFATENRAVGYGLGYSLAVIIPSFYATYQIWLSGIVPMQYTVLVLVGIGGVLAIVGAALGPETKNVEFHPAVEDRAQQSGAEHPGTEHPAVAQPGARGATR
ncbi:MFS transporter [Subtercola lobariae]|uniref:MFS transporter n=1 Tax=Subtercola lobariae TaxID=1588641 RepID=A0A917EXY4_9MICO|nr:MFS transporter [Subtercola lobariae]